MSNQDILKKENYTESYCCGNCKYYSIDDFDTIYNLIISLPELTYNDKNIILTRFKRISTFVSRNYKSIYNYYNISKIFIITAGIITPALMSISGSTTNTSNGMGFNSILFIFIWILQLFISIINSYINFYKWDKKFFLYMAYKNKIEQEIWLYLELSSRYGKINKKNKIENGMKAVSHATKLKLFLNRIEYLYKKLRESEYEIEITDEDNKHDENKELDKDFSPSFLKNTNSIYTTPTPPSTEMHISHEQTLEQTHGQLLNNVKQEQQSNIEMTLIPVRSVNTNGKIFMLKAFRYIENIFILSNIIENRENTEIILDIGDDSHKDECRKNVDAFFKLTSYLILFKEKSREEYNQMINNRWDEIIKQYPGQEQEKYNKLFCEYMVIEQIPIID